jgi:hypothetical protein
VLEIPLQAIRFKVSRFSSNGESINHKAISASKTYRWNSVAGLLVYGLLSKKGSNHLFHAFLRAAMGLRPCSAQARSSSWRSSSEIQQESMTFPSRLEVQWRSGADMDTSCAHVHTLPQQGGFSGYADCADRAE